MVALKLMGSTWLMWVIWLTMTHCDLCDSYDLPWPWLIWLRHNQNIQISIKYRVASYFTLNSWLMFMRQRYTCVLYGEVSIDPPGLSAYWPTCAYCPTQPLLIDPPSHQRHQTYCLLTHPDCCFCRVPCPVYISPFYYNRILPSIYYNMGISHAITI